MPRFIVPRNEMLKLSKAEEIVGEPASAWHGRCYEIASILADHMQDAEAVYGHYTGPVDSEGWWGGQSQAHFMQHGWIIFRHHQYIMDPTRWSFENERPYIFFNAPADEYDEGGNNIREGIRAACPSFDHTKQVVKFLEATSDSALARHLTNLLPSIRMERCLRIDVRQAFWLANTHYCRLEPFAKEIYRGLEAANLKGFVPKDNWARAFRTW